jgi:hypothetical protein
MKFLQFIAPFFLLTTSFVLATPIPGYDDGEVLLVRDVDDSTQIMVKRVYDDPSGMLFRRIPAQPITKRMPASKSGGGKNTNGNPSKQKKIDDSSEKKKQKEKTEERKKDRDAAKNKPSRQASLS